MKPLRDNEKIIVVQECRRSFIYETLDQFPRPWLDVWVREIGGWLQDVHDRDSIGLFWASDLDSLAADRAFEFSRRQDSGRFISPSAFRHTLANMDAGGLALKLRITGPVMTFSLGSDLAVAETSARRFLVARRINAAITLTESPASSDDSAPSASVSIGRTGSTIRRQIHARYLALVP